MSLYVSPERKAEGKANFERAVGRGHLSRRDFMKGVAAGAATVPIAAVVYFGYEKLAGNPVRAAMIGCGDEGGILLTQHTPDFLRFVAVCDIRPTNQKRIFDGQSPWTDRVGFNRKYGANARKEIKQYDDIKQVLDDKEIEAVVIALPLHLHAQVSIDAMKAGKHVLCEKLMAWNVAQCKDMIKAADETGKILAIGHQRHYSLLYAHATEVLKTGELGDIKHIRALWHRNNTWPRYDAAGELMKDDKKRIMLRDGWHPPIADEDRKELESKINQLGYKSMEELVRWRLFQRTGGGLMAELGSHQLDACSIFLNKVHPLAVSGVGTKSFYRDEYKDHEREVDDHVFVTFEFPGPNYHEVDAQGNRTTHVKDKDDVVVVTYSSVNTNSFEPYGECVMGSRGTMTVEMEQSIMLYPERDAQAPAAKAMIAGVSNAGGGKAALDASASTAVVEQKKGADSLGSGSVSRGYTEEMEHFAYCIRMQGKEKTEEGRKKWQQTVKCHGRVAMADAIIALTSNLAMKQRQRVEFKEAWFDAASKEVPEAEMKA